MSEKNSCIKKKEKKSEVGPSDDTIQNGDAARIRVALRNQGIMASSIHFYRPIKTNLKLLVRR